MSVEGGSEGGREEGVDDILAAVALGIAALDPVITTAHTLFGVQRAFGLPLEGGREGGREGVLLAASRWVFARLPAHLRDAVPSPTPLSVRLVWGVCVDDYVRLDSLADQQAAAKTSALISKAKEGGVGAGVGGGRADGAAQFVSASLANDREYFASFLLKAAQTQALLEHLSYLHGLHDVVKV